MSAKRQSCWEKKIAGARGGKFCLCLGSFLYTLYINMHSSSGSVHKQSAVTRTDCKCCTIKSEKVMLQQFGLDLQCLALGESYSHS